MLASGGIEGTEVMDDGLQRRGALNDGGLPQFLLVSWLSHELYNQR